MCALWKDAFVQAVMRQASDLTAISDMAERDAKALGAKRK